MRTTDRSTVMMVRRDRRAAIPDAPYADLDGEPVIEPEADPGRRTTAALPIARAELRAAAAWRAAHADSEATWPREARSLDELPRPAREPARPLARGSTPPPPLAAPWIAPALPPAAAPLPRAPERFARASSPPPLAAPMAPMAPLPRSSMRVSESRGGDPAGSARGAGRSPVGSMRVSEPRGGDPAGSARGAGRSPVGSTAPPYPLVTSSAPRALAPYAPPPRPARVPAADRPIAWWRVFVAVAVMSALMGGAIARLAYRPRAASVAATVRGAIVAPAPGTAASAPAP